MPTAVVALCRVSPSQQLGYLRLGLPAFPHFRIWTVGPCPAARYMTSACSPSTCAPHCHVLLEGCNCQSASTSANAARRQPADAALLLCCCQYWPAHYWSEVAARMCGCKQTRIILIAAQPAPGTLRHPEAAWGSLAQTDSCSRPLLRRQASGMRPLLSLQPRRAQRRAHSWQSWPDRS